MPQNIHVANVVQYKPLMGPCEKCPYRGGPVCGSRGDPKAPIVVIGEAPGAEERFYKLPLIGPSGWVFWHNVPDIHEGWIDSTKFNGVDDRLSALVLEYEAKGELLVLNAMQCRPRDNPKWTPQQAKAVKIEACTSCHTRLMQQVNMHPRKLIIAAGNWAMGSLFGNDYNLKITMLRGQLLPHPSAEYGVLPVIHPAALLRGTGNYRQFSLDMHKGFRLAQTGKWIQPKKFTTTIADSIIKVKHVVRTLLKAKYVASDIETSGLEFYREVLSIGFTMNGTHVFIVPVEFLYLLEPLFNDKKIKWIWHNGKFDISFMRREGVNAARVDEDTMLLSYCLDEGGGIHDLETVAKDLLNVDPWKHLLDSYKDKNHPDKGLAPHYWAPRELLYRYQGFDVAYTYQIWEIMHEMVSKDPHLRKLYYDLLIPASEMLYWVENRGMPVDMVQLEKNRITYLTKYIETIIELNKFLGHECKSITTDQVAEIIQIVKDNPKKKLQTLIRDEIEAAWNPGSQDQMAHIIYDVLKMPDKRNRSTDKKVLKALPEHPFIKLMQKVRQAAKALSQYVTSLEAEVYPDGRIHPTFKLHGTRTGRLSASWNTQNVPREKELRATFAFPADSHALMVDVDENQAELRSLTTLSRDPLLLAIYNSSDRSLHHETAVKLFGIHYDDDQKSIEAPQKMRAKAVNFGIVYGRTAPSIADEFHIDRKEAERYIAGWSKGYPVAWNYIQWCRSTASKGLTLVTPFGRKKRHWIVTRENQHELENEAANFPHQSIASDICLRTATRVIQQLRARGVYIINLVHDSILMECPDDKELVQWAATLVMKTFQEVATEIGVLNIPWKAETKVGKNWGYLVDGKKAGYLN